MAGPQTTLRFAGDSRDLSKALEQVGDDARKMAGEVDKASVDVRGSSARMGEGFDRAGEGADGAETRIMGLKDSVDGAATVMAGPGEQGIAAYLQGWADLASGIANFAIPAIKTVITTSLEQVATTGKAVAATVTGVATQVGQWIVLGAQATAQAARVAAAWLISMGPIVLVGAAVAGLVYLFVEHFDTIKRVVATAVGWVGDRLSGLVGFFRDLPGQIGGAMATVADAILAPYKFAFEQIKKLWNNTVGGFEFSVPSWIPGVGGKGFRIPEMHAGGIVPGAPGTEVTRTLMAGERVVPAGQTGGARAGGNAYTIVVLDPAQVVEAIARYERVNGATFERVNA